MLLSSFDVLRYSSGAGAGAEGAAWRAKKYLDRGKVPTPWHSDHWVFDCMPLAHRRAMRSTTGDDPLIVDLSTPRRTPPPVTPLGEGSADSLSSLSCLASTLDAYPSDVPGFLNDLLAPHLPDLVGHSETPSSTSSDLVGLERTLNDVSTRLSLLSQDTSTSLEQSIHDISRTVPRLTYDLQFMRESATSLQSSLSLVQSRVSRHDPSKAGADTDEAKTHRSLEKLTHLDQLKTRMESARDILREAESWSTLEGEISAFIGTSAWLKAGGRLAEARKSMVVFQNTPGGYESRRTLLVSLQNELEGALAKALQEAIGQGDAEECAKLRQVFEMIERGGEFRDYYFSARRKAVVEEWNTAVILDTTTTVAMVSEGTPAVKFSTFLPRFYSTLLSLLQTETAQMPLIFPPSISSPALAAFLQSIFDALLPSLQSRLSSLADHHGTAALPELIRAYKATEELAVAVQNILDRMAFNTQGGMSSGNDIISSPNAISPHSATPEGVKTPKTPHRRSASRRFSRAPTVMSDMVAISPTGWEMTLFEPFLDLQGTYPSLERRYLSHLLRTDESLSSTVIKGDASRALLDRSNAAFNIAEEAIGRCMAFTHGFGATGMIDALGGFFEDFMDAQRDNVLNPGKSVKVTSGKDATRDELDFEGLDYSTEDWGAFQLGLHVLSACRDVRERLGKFEGTMYEALGVVDRIAKIRMGEGMLNIPDTTMGATGLLQQSPLNSATLHTILSSLDPSASTFTISPARDALSRFTRHAQVYLQDIILSPLQTQLVTYPTLASWTQPDKAPRKGELQVPTFSLSATDTIARVSEGLLNLLRVFEVYAADDALSFSIETLPFVEPELLHEATIHTPTIGTHDAPTRGAQLSSETVLSTWVSSLSLSLLSHLTRSVLPSIRGLSTSGAAQLASDLAYLSNAVRALDVEWEELERWKEATGVKGLEEWRSKLREVREAGGEGEDVWRRLGALRGWS